ncbi:nucleotidyltransferase domain-containing protein [Caproicibacter sp.]|uniref:nucleotidyltransferase domain-containing protein n=1 Tax=Caproicibacter sp. TaxID=2814884 RepID=UPI003989890D
MVDIHQWMKQYQDAVRDLFGGRILLIGLQGSYGRNEAHETSDIDVVLILDTVSLHDLKRYKQVIETLPERPLICGFVSGREELAGWYKSDLFQFYYDTIPYYGSLDDIISAPAAADARAAVLMGACNLYHMCSHNYLHGGDMKTLRTLYKSASFVLQAKHFSETGDYVKSHSALKDMLTGTDLSVSQAAEQIKNANVSSVTLEWYSELLLQWTHQLICEYGQ